MDTTTIILLVLLLACPLMMLFMHRGGHRESRHNTETDVKPKVHDALGTETSVSEEATKSRDTEMAQHGDVGDRR